MTSLKRTASTWIPDFSALALLVFVLWLQIIPAPLWPSRALFLLNMTLVIGITAAAHKIIDLYKAVFEQFEPSTKLEAKIINEKIKYLANLLNGVAISVVAIFGITQAVNPGSISGTLMVVGLLNVLFIVRHVSGLIETMKSEDS